MDDPKPIPAPDAVQVEAPAEIQVGVYADYAAVWHTPVTFVIDFLTVKAPLQPMVDQSGKPTGQSLLPVRVSSRVRIPPEQVFALMGALKTQADLWMAETGKHEPPEQWFPQQSMDSPGNSD